MASQSDQEKYPELFVPDRDVDPRTRGRTKEMKILNMSMPRTGTSSMEEALKILGYGPVCHGFNFHVHNQDMLMWDELIKNKFFHPPGAEAPPASRKEFDHLLGDYEVVGDFPLMSFSEELITAYPEAKVILVERDLESWYRSFESTLILNFFNPINTLICSLDYKLGIFAGMAKNNVRGWFGASNEEEFKARARPTYIEHYRFVREITPKERLLDFKLAEGWKPLCEFLGKEIPDVPFPRINDTQEFQKKTNIMVKIAVKRVFWKSVPAIGVMSVATVGYLLSRAM